MLEAPSIEAAQIVACLRDQYGLTITEV